MHSLLFFTLLMIALFLEACGASSDSSSPAGSVQSGPNQSNPSQSSSNVVQATPVSNQPALDDSESADSNFFYFSYDDSGSSAARDLTIYSLLNGNWPSSDWARPYEFLNAESFLHFEPETMGPFELSMGLMPLVDGSFLLAEGSDSLAEGSDSLAEGSDSLAEGSSTLREVAAEYTYALGVNISGPTLTRDARQNVVLTLLVDISGSMSTSYVSHENADNLSRLDVLKIGLGQLATSLKPGDRINIVTFESEAEVVVESLEVFDDNYLAIINRLETQGATNLDKGIALAYTVANRNFDSDKSNRVIILTDAFANTGEIDASIIASHTTINNAEGIYFAGVGIGEGFNEPFLNELTDIGKSVFIAMITPDDAERIFNEQFMRFLQPAVKDIRFKLEYPGSLNHIASAAEEVSQEAEDIQPIHFSYNDDQFFFEGFAAEIPLADDDAFVLEITYTDNNNEQQTLRLERTVSQIQEVGHNQISSASAIFVLTGLMAGNLSCGEVVNSPLMMSDITETTFVFYRQLIHSFCDL